MKAWIVAGLALLLLLPVSTGWAIGTKTVTIQLSSGKKSVSYVSFHPSEPLELRPALAQGKVGMTQELAQIAVNNKAVAAINGTFFNPYDENDLQPMGGIIINGVPQHIRGGAVAMGITASNELIFAPGNPYSVRGTINSGTQEEKEWSVQYVNHLPTMTETVLFTPSFRSANLFIPGYHFVVITAGKVSGFSKEKAVIPSNGFVIARGGGTTGEGAFRVGDSVSYELTASEAFKQAVHMISVGPRLIAAGKAAVDTSTFTEAKITTQKAQRSFIGCKADKTIMMGTVGNVTMQELTELGLKLGLTEAMALDGGASSGLFYNGKYVTKAGRNLSNALVVVKKAPPAKPAAPPAPPVKK
ncbi:MAG: phosphodiester glycosidase family protein [Clostridia bacterium]